MSDTVPAEPLLMIAARWQRAARSVAGQEAERSPARVRESVEVVVELFGDAAVSLDLAGPTPLVSVVAESCDIGELGVQRGNELRGRHEVIALLADVGVGAGFLARWRLQ